MQRRRVCATADDIRIAPVVGVAQLERVGDLRVNLVLPLGSGGDGPRPLVGLNADIDRMLQQLQFHLRFAEAHVRKDWRRIMESEAAIRLFPISRKALFPPVFLAVHLALRFARRQQIDCCFIPGGGREQFGPGDIELVRPVV